MDLSSLNLISYPGGRQIIHLCYILEFYLRAREGFRLTSGWAYIGAFVLVQRDASLLYCRFEFFHG